MSDAITNLNAAIKPALKNFRPPEDITVDGWANKHRVLSPETSAEPGPWRTSRTPYLKEPMEAFNDPRVHKIVMVAASQVGKTEIELNILGYIMDQDPGSILYIHPTLEEAKKFSRTRIAPMIRDCRALRHKVSDVKSRSGDNTLLQKTFPGGILTIAGSNSPQALSSMPCRYIIGDERDRWAIDAGNNGDPWLLAEARQTTFYNRKAIEVSTPTIKGASRIETAFVGGTQEYWCTQCPSCGEWHNITFDQIKFDHTVQKVRGKKTYLVESICWVCPDCGHEFTEDTMRQQPSKWIATYPDGLQNGVRSFWLNAFASPWTGWQIIIQKFLDAQDDPQMLQVVYNTLFGELWEDRGELMDEEVLMTRREQYDAQLPDGVLVLTCGVDTQDDRLEYEVVGHGHYGETWGIRRGVIPGDPIDDEVWQQLDQIIDKTYLDKSGRGMTISSTFVDSGGHRVQEVYAQCCKRIGKRVFAIKGRSAESVPYVAPPKKVAIKDKKATCWLYTLGVDTGKEIIMSSLKVQEPGPKYCHFPINEEAGYNYEYFRGLLSEKMVYDGKKWSWQKLPGHRRNEALDCRNYALAAFKILSIDLFALERQRKGLPPASAERRPVKKRQPKRQSQAYDDW